jgi:hypothetical protein
MTRRLIRFAVVASAIAGLTAVAAPAHADPCDINVKDIIVIDLINCG